MKIKDIRLCGIKLFTDFNLSFIDGNTNEPHNVILIVGENGKVLACAKTEISIAAAYKYSKDNDFLHNGRIIGGKPIKEVPSIKYNIKGSHEYISI